jgi:tetratricopeptide (TPR) repeat protein
MQNTALFWNKMKAKIWPGILMIVVTAVAFTPSLFNGFTAWDDNSLLLDNPQIVNFSAGGVGNAFLTFHHGLYHPLVNLSFRLEHQLFGFNPFIYHLTNLLLHLFNVVLAYIFIIFLGGGLLLAAGVALLFGVHPLHVESVAWVAERKDLLYTLFFLSGLIAYLRFRAAGHKWLYAAAWTLCLLSLGAKAMAVSFPFVLLLIDYFQARRVDAKNLLEKLPFFLLTAVFAVLAVLARHYTGGLTSDPALSGDNIFIGSYRLVFYYFGRVFLPWLDSPLYPGVSFSQKIFTALPFIYYAAPLLALGIFGLLFWLARRERGVVFGLGFFLLAIAPALVLIPVGPFADRFTYLSSLGLFFASGLVIKRLRFERPAIAGLAILLAVFSVMTWQRCAVWRDNYALWTAAAQKYPLSAEVANNRAFGCLERGIYFGRLGREGEALQELNQALELAPGLAEAYFDRGNVYAALGRRRAAAADYRRALALEPKLRLNLPPDFARIGP